MPRRVELVTPLHQRTQRDYLARMNDDKVRCMSVAKRYGADFWDGARRFGYGGYYYDGRWRSVAERLVERYQLRPDARILDVGCGKGFLLYELQQLLPRAQLSGIDISEYALEHAHPELRADLRLARAQDPLPFADGVFDLVLSLGTLHNLQLPELQRALPELQRVARHAYLMVESYRNDRELFNLQCWALTCESFFREEEWCWLLQSWGYQGDYELIFFE